MALDEKYISGVALGEVFVDKDSGSPLAGGTIEFCRDSSRAITKDVYQLSSANGAYSYVAMPNPVNLSNAGTIENAANTNVALYYYPFLGDPADDSDTLDLYYVVVKDSSGTIQYTRQAWPTIASEASPTENENSLTNQMLNPQFIDVLFNASSTLTISVSGSGTTTVAIAPEWDLIIAHDATGTVDVTRNNVAGTSHYPANTPYTLTVLGNVNLTSLKLRQRFTNNPGIWTSLVEGTAGYIAVGALAAPGHAFTIDYAPSSGAATEVLSVNNTTGSYTQFQTTTQLTPTLNASEPDVGYVDIIIKLAATGTTEISNLHLVTMSSNEQNVPYEQVSANRQRSELLNYYNPLLQAKPIPSYLVGWDFHLNPAQFGENITASAIGANKSKYVWDQTIIFQDIDSSIDADRDTSGNLVLTADIAGQVAVIQYIEQDEARAILSGDLCVNVRAKSNSGTAVTGAIGLYYTTDANLPDVSSGTNESLVTGLTAGVPAVGAGAPNGTWTTVDRSNLGNNPTFTLTTSMANYGFRGWSDTGAGSTTATFAAIVVGFSAIDLTKNVTIESISLQRGDIPTVPAPLPKGNVVLACQRYYEKSFALDVVAAQSVAINNGEHVFYQMVGIATSQVVGSVEYRVNKRATTPTVTLYSPVNASDQVYDLVGGVNWTGTSKAGVDSGFKIFGTSPGAGAQFNTCAVHWTSDARLGIV